MRLAKKLVAIFRVYVKECFAYPAASAIWVLADTQTALVLPAVWLASAGSSGLVGGLDRDQLITYYLCTMTLSQFVICHLMWDISWDMKEGFFSPQLLRPLGYFRMTLARNLSWRVAKLALFLPVLPVVWLAYGGIQGSALNFGWGFWVAVILAHFLSLLAAFALAMVALWTTEYMSILRLYYVPELFLSGRVLPLGTLPEWARSIADSLHFSYMIAFPTNVLLGRLDDSAIGRGIAIQLAWCVAFLILGRILFLKGVRVYSGPGM
ncbi:MAG TPA: ABC-2 family transporter protein [Fimbriimonadaceae bacterium]|nr:ABC-2 family transporter protein [Fimbriimonadaceae bacterium]HRJ95107.1 ABC-2 family transporter protein [Fimbriimonadaceae bacterium]